MTWGAIGGVISLGAALAACAASGDGPGPSGGAGAGGPDGGPGATSGGGDLPFDAGGGGGEPLPSVIYAHTNTALYRGDPSVTPLVMELVGDFDCIGGPGEDTSMTDIGVSDEGEIWSVSVTSFHRLEIQGGTVHCAASFPLDNPADIRFYGLTFAPKGVFAPDAEILVAGNSAGELYTIDSAGNLEQHGTFGAAPADDGNGHAYPFAGQPWELSGDIVFLANGGSPIGFATVRDCPSPPSTNGCNPTDTLIELDVGALPGATTQSITKSVRGQTVKRAGCSAAAATYGSVYGITAWQTKIFGFSRAMGDGYAIDIDNTDGSACAIQAFPGEPWAGAGITTLAPVVPPPPK